MSADNNLTKQTSTLQQDIRQLKNKLSVLYKEKESFFSDKTKISEQIKALIKDIQGEKKSRNFLTDSLKDVKVKRKQLNTQILIKINLIKKFRLEQKAVTKKFHIKENPVRIKAEIEKLHFTIETGAISFKKEQEFMKKINELKLKIKGAENISEVFDKTHSLSTEINKLKEDADAKHKHIQKTARESQLKHEEIIKTSKEIDDLIKKEKEAKKLFQKKKGEYDKFNMQLREKIAKLKELTGEIDTQIKTKREKRQNSMKQLLLQKQKEVEEKLKQGKKLTTQDLLIMRGK